MENKRGSWGSDFGFLMAAVGSAIGLGNLWGFPYKMGSNGGFAFLVVYCVLVIVVGFALVLGELALGRKTGFGAVGAYKAMCKKHRWIGLMGVAAGFIILAFYFVLGGMVLRYVAGYFVNILGGDGFVGQGTGFFGYLLYDINSIILYSIIFIVISCAIVMGGIKGGIEKFSKVAMPALAVFLIIVIIYVASQKNAGAGYRFMFKPDWTYFRENFFTVLKTAAGQMLFSLSLGMGCMMTYGSYLPKNAHLQRNATIIPIADTAAALLAGCAVLPAVAAFAGENYGSGPGLLFHTMLQVFGNMNGVMGDLMGFLFFLLIFLAAVTSSISQMEVCNASIIDRRIEKKKAPRRPAITIFFALSAFIIGIPCAMDAMGSGGAAIKAPFEFLGLTAGSPGYQMWNSSWLNLYEFISEGILMPLGALIMSLLIGWVYKTRTVRRECEASGQRFKAGVFFSLCYKIIVPIIIGIVLCTQIIDLII